MIVVPPTPFEEVIDDLERRRLEVAVQRIRAVAVEVELVAARLAGGGADGWSGGARRRHDRATRTLEVELRAVAAVLCDVADDAAVALAVAVRRAGMVDLHAQLMAGAGSRDAAPPPAASRAPSVAPWTATGVSVGVR